MNIVFNEVIPTPHGKLYAGRGRMLPTGSRFAELVTALDEQTSYASYHVPRHKVDQSNEIRDNVHDDVSYRP